MISNDKSLAQKLITTSDIDLQPLFGLVMRDLNNNPIFAISLSTFPSTTFSMFLGKMREIPDPIP